MSGSDSPVKAKGVIHWVNADDCVRITANRYDYLLLPVTDGVTDFNERINPHSRTVFSAVAEPAVNDGNVFQFMRQGYFTRDSKQPDVFQETVGLKDSFNVKPIR